MKATRGGNHTCDQDYPQISLSEDALLRAITRLSRACQTIPLPTRQVPEPGTQSMIPFQRSTSFGKIPLLAMCLCMRITLIPGLILQVTN
jgi:hypothetical protein